VRLGRAIGPYAITATSTMALGPVTIMATATAPPDGTLFPIANTAHTSGSTTVAGPATASQMGAVRGVAVASDGTVYVADYTYHVVRAVSPEGVATIVAGRSGMLGVTGDLGPATMALLRNPSGLALDGTGGILYIADTGNNRVRAVTLATGIISTVAGGGAAIAPDYGDGGGATSATLAAPGHVRLGADGALYISDVTHNRIRRVDLTTGIITAWLTGNTTCTGVTLQLYGCQAEQRSCDVAFDASGRAFVSGYFCGSAIGTTTWAIVRRDTDGTLTRVAGISAGLTADGAAASASLVNGAGTLGLDPAGNLYYVETTSQRVRRIDATQASVSTVVGTGLAGYGADFVPAAGQPTSGLWGLAFDSQRTLYLSETGNFVVRAIWRLGATTASSARLAVFAGGMQTLAVDAQVPTAFSVQLTDAGGAGLAGLPVQFVPVDEGAGVVATSATTTAMGVASVFGRPGLLPGTYRVEGRFSDLRGTAVMGSPATFTMTATAPAAGTIFTAVNVARTTGAIAGPATYGRVGQVAALVAAADGTIYISDRTQHAVWSLSPQGALTRVAGTPPTAGFLGDGGPATAARLNAPSGLALDAPRNILYVADTSNNRVRAIDLTTRNISSIAGGGLTTMPAPYGDLGPATSAYIAAPGNVSVDAMGQVYVSDTGHNRIRVVDPVLGLIDAWLGTTAGCTTTPLVFYGCGSAPASCRVLFEPDGSAIISGQICGNVAPLSTTAAYGIVRRATDGTLTHVAGMRLGATTDGTAAPMAGIGGAGWLMRASDGALHYVDFGTHRIRRIDPVANTVSTIAGTGTAGFAGEYVAASTAQLSTPWGIVLSGGHLFVADSGNFAVRAIW